MQETAEALPGSELAWREWLGKHYPHVCKSPFGQRHIAFWDWIDRLELGVRPKAFIAVWPRGGAKSTTVELGVARVCAKLSRRFVLIVSETQEQADKHVQAIASLLEKIGVERAVNQYGTSKSWKRQQLRTANGFNVAGFGLDVGSRGVKLDEFRPDWIVLDDIDGRHDTAATTEKKRQIITETLLPAGSVDCAVSFLQNRITEDSLISQIADNRADFLLRREPVSEEPAVIGLTYETRQDTDGTSYYAVTGGIPTWEGQSLAVCEEQINTWGLNSFLREGQHEVENANGIFFRDKQLRTVPLSQVPTLKEVGLAFDLAATEDGGDHTAGVLMGSTGTGQFYILALLHGQWSSERVRQVIDLACNIFLPQHKNSFLRLPQDPAQAGKSQALQMAKLFAKWKPRIKVVGQRNKATRAEGLQEAVNLGNVWLVEQDIPDKFLPYIKNLSWQFWHHALRTEFRKFREDESHEADDIVDAASDDFNEMVGKRKFTLKVA